MLIVLLAVATWVDRIPWRSGLGGRVEVRLPELPSRLGEWSSTAYDFSHARGFENYVGSRLGGRRYTDPSGRVVDLFLVGTARLDQFHTPEFCYQSDGFNIVEDHTETFDIADGQIRAKRLRVARTGQNQDVLYWFQNGGTTANHRALIKMAALARVLQGRPPEPLVLYRFSCAEKDGGSPLDGFVRRMLPYLEHGALAARRRGQPSARAASPS